MDISAIDNDNVSNSIHSICKTKFAFSNPTLHAC